MEGRSNRDARRDKWGVSVYTWANVGVDLGCLPPG